MNISDSVNKAIKDISQIIVAHLNFEGVAYIKFMRTGKAACIAIDDTSNVLSGDDPKNRYKNQEIFWKKPAVYKWADERKGKRKKRG